MYSLHEKKFIVVGYVKASPDEAVIISGVKRNPRIIRGRASVMIPFFERKDRLTLKVIKIDVKTKESVPTQEFINVNVDAVVTVKIRSDEDLLHIAAQNFLNKDEAYIQAIVGEVLEGNVREIVGTMTLENMISNRQEFALKVQQNAVPDMQKMGIEIVSFNVQNFSDKSGIIEDLGIDNTMKIKKVAAISKAEADAAYEIQKEEQRKTIEITTANANLAKQEKEIEIKERDVQIKEKSLEAEIKKKAEGIEKKAIAMEKMKEAAILEMYFNVLPDIAKNVSEPLANIDKITMYGEGNSAKMVKDIINSTTQISEGLTEGLGIDMKSLISGLIGGKMVMNHEHTEKEEASE